MNKIAPLYKTLQKAPVVHSALSKVAGINRISKQRIGINSDEKFKVLNTSHGAFLQATLNTHDKLIAKIGSITASFGKVETNIRTFKSFGEATKRKFAGGSFYLEEFVADKQSTLLVGSAIPGDIALLTLNSTQDFIFRSEAFLALSGDIKLDISPSGFGMGDGGFFFGLAHGDGIIALSKPASGLICLDLEPNETIHVQPRNIVAWDSSMKYEPVISDALPASKRAIWRNLEWMTQKRIPFRHAVEATLYYSHSLIGSVVHWFRYWVIGERGSFKFSGPGQILVSTEKSK